MRTSKRSVSLDSSRLTRKHRSSRKRLQPPTWAMAGLDVIGHAVERVFGKRGSVAPVRAEAGEISRIPIARALS